MLRLKIEDAVIVGCELEVDKRNPERGEQKAVRVDFGGGIVTRFALDTPGVDMLGVGVKFSGEVDLDSTSIMPWHIPSDTEGQAGRSGYALKNVLIKKLDDGQGNVEEIKPKLEKKNWSEMTPSRERSAFTPRGPAAAAASKAGGEREEEEEHIDHVE